MRIAAQQAARNINIPVHHQQQHTIQWMAPCCGEGGCPGNASSQGSCLEAGEALVGGGSLWGDPQDIEAHCLGQRPAAGNTAGTAQETDEKETAYPRSMQQHDVLLTGLVDFTVARRVQAWWETW